MKWIAAIFGGILVCIILLFNKGCNFVERLIFEPIEPVTVQQQIENNK